MKSAGRVEKFSAPWGRGLRTISISVTALMVGLMVIGMTNPRLPGIAMLPLSILPVLLLGGTAALMVLGYEIEDGFLVIRRPGWATRAPLAGLREALMNPTAMRGSIRIFGNGGMFSFTGLFWN